jgi:hypothetical protein
VVPSGKFRLKCGSYMLTTPLTYVFLEVTSKMALASRKYQESSLSLNMSMKEVYGFNDCETLHVLNLDN